MSSLSVSLQRQYNVTCYYWDKNHVKNINLFLVFFLFYLNLILFFLSEAISFLPKLRLNLTFITYYNDIFNKIKFI